MKKIIDNFNNNRYIIFLSLFAGFIAAVYYIYQGITYTISLYTTGFSNLLFMVINLVIGLVVFFALKKWFMLLTLTFKNKIRKIDIQKDINIYSKLTQIDEFYKILPSNNMLVRWFKELAEEAINWSEDSHLMSLSLYLSIAKNEIKPILQGLYLSELKEEERYFYVGNDYKTVPEETDKKKNKCIAPFFYIYPAWDKAVNKAYSRIRDKLPNKYSLAIHSHYSMLHFEFSYESGVVRKEVFESDLKSLLDKKNGKTFQL